MKKIYYDFHIHTILSPCGDVDSTPNNVVNMAKIKGLDAIAITDHNAVSNARACMEVGKSVGLTVIPGMELTTSEDVHVVCLFSELEKAESFGEEVSSRRMKIKNKEQIFGEQIIMNSLDEEIGREEDLLILATDIGVYDVKSLVEKYGGVCYPAHIDRPSNGILQILGAIDPEMGFTAAEVSLGGGEDAVGKAEGLFFIRSSDAHNIVDIAEREDAAFIEAEENTAEDILNTIRKKRE